MQKINDTFSLCDVCLKRIKAEVIQKDNKIFIKKKCSKHGQFISPHVWDNPETYKFLTRFEKFKFPSRKVLLNITNQCNLNCKFCYAKANEINITELKLEDIKKIDISNYEYIYLSGGEPTIKNDLIEIIKHFKQNKKKVIILSNGVRLKNIKYVKALKKAGLDMVFLQFDSLDEKQIIYLRGTPLLKTKLKVIENLNKENLPVYFFSILLKKRNIETIADLVKYFIKNKKVIKGINLNTLWKIGRRNDENWVSTDTIMKNACKVMQVTKNDFLISTEFCYYFFILLSSLKNKRRYFSRCMLFLLTIFDEGKIIPVTRIFNVGRLTEYMKEILIKNKKQKYLNLAMYIIFSQFFMNFFINNNFRLFLWESIKKMRYIFSKNTFLMNPFTTFNVGAFPTAEDLDFNFIDTCNLYFYSPEHDSVQPLCVNQIKFARSNHPLYSQR